MKMDLRGPCSNCPFRKDIKPYIRLDRMLSIIQILIGRDGNFVCHKTTKTGADEFERDVVAGSQHCGGALVFLMKHKAPNQMMRIMGRLGVFKPERLDMAAPVFDNLSEIRKKFKRSHA